MRSEYVIKSRQLDIFVNNAGMLVVGIIEAFTRAYDRIADLPPRSASRLHSLNKPGVRTDVEEVAEQIRAASMLFLTWSARLGR
ncbi:MAG: hypothetical protein AAFP04_03920 [Myxococcota bacterium]